MLVQCQCGKKVNTDSDMLGCPYCLKDFPSQGIDLKKIKETGELKLKLRNKIGLLVFLLFLLPFSLFIFSPFFLNFTKNASFIVESIILFSLTLLMVIFSGIGFSISNRLCAKKYPPLKGEVL